MNIKKKNKKINWIENKNYKWIFALSLECILFVNEKIFLNDSGLSIKPKTDILLHKYVGYYLLHNQSIIYNCARGTAQINLEMDIFKLIKIPIPPIDKQREIIKYLDFIYEKAIKTSNDKILELKMLNEFCLNNQKIFGENVVKELGDVFKEVKTGKDVVATERKKGEYIGLFHLRTIFKKMYISQVLGW